MPDYKSVKFERNENIYHSTHDPNLPSFEVQGYVNNKSALELAEDMYQGLNAWVRYERIDSDKAVRYLPRRPREEDDGYIARLLSSSFHRFFGRTVERFASLLSVFELVGPHSSIEDNIKNIDKQGSSLSAFKLRCDRYAIRDLWCGILVEYPRRRTDVDGNIQPLTEREESELNLRPYLVMIAREDVPNWTLKIDDRGQVVFESVTIRRYDDVKAGEFGTEQRIRYYCYQCKNSSEGYNYVALTVYEIEQRDENNPESIKKIVALDENGVEMYNMRLSDVNGNLISEIPFTPYSANSIEPMDSPPPLLDMAELNKTFYQGFSNYWDGLATSQMPGLARIWPQAIMEGVDFIWGPHHINEVPGGGDIKLLEFQGAGAASMRQALIDLKEDIKEEGLAFLGQGSYAQTDDEIALKTAIAETTLYGMAVDSESQIEKVFEYWVRWLGETGTGGTIEISKDMLRSPLTAQEYESYVNSIFTGVSEELIETKLRQRKFIPKDYEGPFLREQTLNSDDDVLSAVSGDGIEA
ncbi:MAG: DUF4055 domain-containing protein [Cyanobacteria bacterium P01_D01_bin.36]